MNSDSAQRITGRLTAKTLSGLEETLAGELTALGAADAWPGNRAVEFSGDKELLYKVNLWCRTATRVLLPIASFPASDSDQLYQGVAEIDWAKHLDPEMTLAVDAIAIESAFDNSLFVAQRVKDAIVDQFRKRSGKRPSVDADNPGLRINIHIHGDKATLSLDSSGGPLTRRGYRIEGGKAPLSEVLAAGIVRLTEWDMASPLIDPMCGSGTIVIEAAMAARNIAPGILRKQFGFMRWKDYDEAVYRQLVREARQAVKADLPIEIVGSDIDRHAIDEAKANARRAGVEGNIRFEVKPFDRQTPPPSPGTVVMNPPYGERIAVKDIEAFYESLGDILKQKYQGYTSFILSGNPEAAGHIGLRTSRRVKLFNGPLECRLLRFELYKGSRKSKYQSPEPE
jgi:putative N6-adenine-specific DNA methylase